MDIFQYEFMQRALAAGLVIGIICPLAGIFLVLRRLSLLGDALSHISLTGVAAGLVCSINATLSALVFALAGSLGIEYLAGTIHNMLNWLSLWPCPEVWAWQWC